MGQSGRHSIRWRGYDYRQPGWYFVTLCSQDRKHIFAAVQNQHIQLNHLGLLVQSCWLAIPEHFPEIQLDHFIVMPNHIHGIIVIAGAKHGLSRLTTSAGSFRPCFAPTGTTPGSLGAIVQNFKSVTTRKIHQLDGYHEMRVWQRNYYEHIIRVERELNTIRKYIIDNPARWVNDRFHSFSQGRSKASKN